MISCFGVKGGSGTSVVAAAIAVVASGDPHGALLVDLCGDQPALLGRPEPTGPGVVDWLHHGADAPPDAIGRLEVDVGPGLRLLPAGSPTVVAARPPGSTAAGHGAGPEGGPVGTLASVLGRDQRTVVVDGGLPLPGEPATDLVAAAAQRLLVIRPCYLALRRAALSPVAPTGVVVVTEPGRALRPPDVAGVVGVPVVAVVEVEPAVARAVDAGVLATRLPRSLQRSLEGVR
jgi:hypothetical protein